MVTGYQLPGAGFQLPVTSHQLRGTSHQLPVEARDDRVTVSRLQVTGLFPQITHHCFMPCNLKHVT